LVEIKTIIATFLKNFEIEVNQEVKLVIKQMFAAGPEDDRLVIVKAK
jgi:hypothetical protein